MEKKLKVINSLIISAITAVIFITLITVIADLYSPTKNWLKNIFTHHWVGKGILASSLFIVLTFLFSLTPFSVNENKLIKNLWLLFAISLLGTLVIFSFYIYETFLI
jgi:hypothetical protein